MKPLLQFYLYVVFRYYFYSEVAIMEINNHIYVYFTLHSKYVPNIVMIGLIFLVGYNFRILSDLGCDP